jgi:hypothetical protein
MNVGGACMAYLLVGIGTRASYVANLTSNLHNWKLELRGRVVALLVSFLGLSSAILTGIYAGALNRVVSSFVLLLLCVSSSLSVLGAFVISETPCHNMTPIIYAFVPYLRHHHPQKELPPPTNSHWEWKRMFKTASFWLIASSN